MTTRPTRPATRSATRLGAHAIVIGGSMAGLFAARVLADQFEHVTVVERDQLPEGPEYRPGVPQSRHVHVLLRRGLVVMEELFPGLERELIAAGGISFTNADCLALPAAGWLGRFDGPRLLSGSRELLEWTVRGRVRALDNVDILCRQEVIGLFAKAVDGPVGGVDVRERGVSGTPSRRLTADLVVDASGRASKAPEWLESLGYPKPEETVINSFLGYASRFYEVPPDVEADWKVLLVDARPPAMLRGGAVLPVEGHRWLVTLAGYGRDYPPTDEAGFLEFARSLRTPLLHEAIRSLRPLSTIRGYRITANQRRRYESLPRRPEGLVVVGDAACAFNPVYGQGMTVAAMTALGLRRLLVDQVRTTGDLSGFGLRAQKQVAEASGGAWMIAGGADARFPTTIGIHSNFFVRLMQRYLDRVQATSTRDEVVSASYQRVVHLVDDVPSLLRPVVLLRTLRGAGRPLAEPPLTRPRPGLAGPAVD